MPERGFQKSSDTLDGWMGNAFLGCTENGSFHFTNIILFIQANIELAATYAALILADDNVEITVRLVRLSDLLCNL